MVVDLSFIGYFVPILAFLIVSIVCYAVLNKTEILGKHWPANIFVSLIVASLFVSSVGLRDFTVTLIPWFGVLIVSLVFVIVIVSFIGVRSDGMNKGIAITFLTIMGLVFLISAFVVFSEIIGPYLPGPGFGTGDNIRATAFFDWLYSSRVAGAILLIVISAIVSWILVKSGK